MSNKICIGDIGLYEKSTNPLQQLFSQEFQLIIKIWSSAYLDFKEGSCFREIRIKKFRILQIQCQIQIKLLSSVGVPKEIISCCTVLSWDIQFEIEKIKLNKALKIFRSRCIFFVIMIESFHYIWNRILLKCPLRDLLHSSIHLS